MNVCFCPFRWVIQFWSKVAPTHTHTHIQIARSYFHYSWWSDTGFLFLIIIFGIKAFPISISFGKLYSMHAKLIIYISSSFLGTWSICCVELSSQFIRNQSTSLYPSIFLFFSRSLYMHEFSVILKVNVKKMLTQMRWAKTEMEYDLRPNRSHFISFVCSFVRSFAHSFV